jgi:hypothetical protein
VLFDSVLEDGAIVVPAEAGAEAGDATVDDAADSGADDGMAAADVVPDVRFVLPCTPGAPNTPLCDGFEGRTDPNGTAWYTTDDQGAASTLSIQPIGGSGSMQFARFNSDVGATGSFFLGHDGPLPATPIFWVSVDVRLAYVPASYTGGARRGLINVSALSGGTGGTTQGSAGIALTGSGLVVEASATGAAARTTKPLESLLNGTAWHRVELEVTLSPALTGQVRTWIDNRPQPTIAAQPTVSAAVDAFSFSIGANAQGSQPLLNAEYDNVSVHFGARP